VTGHAGPDADLGSPSARPGGLPRALDLALAGAGLLIASPLLAIAAAAIRLDSRGPVIYRQPRAGRDGATFSLYKLRTMRQGSDPVGVGQPVLEDDPLVTRVGAVLRRFSLDEVPNLINVLRGEMAMVGPPPNPPPPGRRVHATPATPPRGQAGRHRVGPGQRADADPVGGTHRARHLVRRSPLTGARCTHPRSNRAAVGHRPGPLRVSRRTTLGGEARRGWPRSRRPPQRSSGDLSAV
jgi:hypothetical protein